MGLPWRSLSLNFSGPALAMYSAFARACSSCERASERETDKKRDARLETSEDRKGKRLSRFAHLFYQGLCLEGLSSLLVHLLPR